MPTTDTPIRKELRLPVAPDRAFALFTDGIAAWWPMASHSVGGDEAMDVRIEGRVGGRGIETTRDGTTHVWGTITTWEPPHRLVLDWHPGGDPEDPSEVEVRFEPDGEGCRLILEHRGWERATWVDRRDSYDGGWDRVLAPYTEAARAEATASPISPGPA